MPIVLKSGSLNLLEPSGPVQACNGVVLPIIVLFRAVLRDCDHLSKLVAKDSIFFFYIFLFVFFAASLMHVSPVTFFFPT